KSSSHHGGGWGRDMKRNSRLFVWRCWAGRRLHPVEGAGWPLLANSSTPVLLMVLNAVLGNQPVQSPAADTQELGGVNLVAFGLLQDLQDMTPLDLAQMFRIARGASISGQSVHHVVREIVQGNDMVFCHDLGPLQRVGEPSNISRPIVVDQRL